MPDRNEMEYNVVGAGPAGLAAATWLADAGLSPQRAADLVLAVDEACVRTAAEAVCGRVWEAVRATQET